MAILIALPRFRALDANGDPLSGGKVYFYEAGTTTPKDTFTDDTSGTPNANPVVLDSQGYADVWGAGAYKIRVDNSLDVTQFTVDNVEAGGTTIADGAVTNAKLADMNANTVKARAASTSGSPSDVALSASNLLGRGDSGNIAAISVTNGLAFDGTTLQAEGGIEGVFRTFLTTTSTSITFALDRSGEAYIWQGSSAATITIPTNATTAFPNGTELELFNDGTDDITLTASSGVTVNGVTAGSITLTTNQGGVLKKITINRWIWMGDNKTSWS